MPAAGRGLGEGAVVSRAGDASRAGAVGVVHVVHANVRVDFGKFWWLLSSPQYHRIHCELSDRTPGKRALVEMC